MEPEVKEILDKHEEKIENLRDVQTKLLVQNAEMFTKLSNIEISQSEIKIQLQEFIKQHNEKDKVVSNNLWQLFIKLFTWLLGLGSAWFIGKHS